QLLNPVRPAKFNVDILALGIVEITQARAQRLDPARAGGSGPEVEVSGARDLCPLPRACRDRPRRRRTAEQRDELAPHHSITSSARAGSVMNPRRSDAHYVVGCGVDCHAMNFQPFGVFVQALRNTSLRLRGWPLISASIATRPVTSAASPARRTLRSLQAALL